MNSTPTDFDPDDQLVLPHFEERLLSQLLDERGAEPILLPLVAPRLRPRAPRRALIAAAAAVVAVAGIAGAVAVRGDDRPSVSTVHQPDPEQLQARIIAAIHATATKTVVHTVDSSGMQLWHDSVSGLSRNSTVGADTWGQVEMGPAVAPALDDPTAPLGTAPDVRVRRVDHCVGQYAEKDEPWFNMDSAAESFADELKADRFVPDGTEIVDGRELIRLRAVDGQPRSDRQPAHDDRVAYVDPVTLLPVRIDSASAQISMTIEYLPRTAESLALLVPPIPAGTVRVDELPRNGDPATLCNGG